jgi:scyllo-inositol 2-dehydrogenase (NADP+)
MSKEKMTKSVINVGLIGYGLAGAVFHAPLIQAEKRLKLKAISTSRTLGPDLAGLGRVESGWEIVSDPSVDLVVVASPNDTHASFARAALLAGKHVVVDKPFTIRLSEAEALVELAEACGRLLTVFQNRRWDSNFITVKKCLDAGTLGEVSYCELHYDRFVPVIKDRWRERPGNGAGLFYDLGPHLIDQSLCLFGMPTSVFALSAHQRKDASVDDFFHVALSYGRLVVVLHASVLTYALGPRMLLHGDRGSLFQFGLDGQEDALKAGQRPGDPGWGITPDMHAHTVTSIGRTDLEIEPGAYETFYNRVAGAILDGGPLPVAPAEARNVMAVIEAARRSAAERRVCLVL